MGSHYYFSAANAVGQVSYITHPCFFLTILHLFVFLKCGRKNSISDLEISFVLDFDQVLWDSLNFEFIKSFRYEFLGTLFKSVSAPK